VARISTLIELGSLDPVKLREYAGRVTQNVKESVPEDFPYSELHAAARALLMIAGSESLETNEGWSGKKPIACLEWLSLSIEYILQFSKTSFVAECGGTFWQNSFSRCRKTFYDVERLNDDKGANSYPNKQERVTEYELQTPIRLIGAELEFLFHRIDKQQIAENNQDWAGDYLELPRLYNHLLCFISDLRLGESHKERTPYSVAAIA
jgi:hypothetical protein